MTVKNKGGGPMDFMNRSVRANQPSTYQPESSGDNKAPRDKGPSRLKKGFAWTKVGSVGFLISITILISSALLALILVKSSPNEAQLIDRQNLQAVLINMPGISGGQFYFGKISELNKQYIELSDIYYLRPNQETKAGQDDKSTQNGFSLIKWGCELHKPQDSLVINRDQVIYWHNLENDGQVAKKVAEFVKQNPNGQKCSEAQQPSADNSSKTPDKPAATPTPTAPIPAPATPATPAR